MKWASLRTAAFKIANRSDLFSDGTAFLSRLVLEAIFVLWVPETKNAFLHIESLKLVVAPKCSERLATFHWAFSLRQHTRLLHRVSLNLGYSNWPEASNREASNRVPKHDLRRLSVLVEASHLINPTLQVLAGFYRLQ